MTRSTAFAVLCAVGASCMIEVSRGDFAVSGSWTLFGGQPTAAACGSANAARVDVVFLRARVENRRLSYPCDAGRFDTRPAYALPWGPYQAQLIAYDTNHMIVAKSEIVDVIVTAPARLGAMPQIDLATP